MPRRASTARILLAAALPCAILAAACSERRPATAANARPLVVVSIAPLAHLVERLAGPVVDVQVLLPPGANPHAFEPGLADAQALARAGLTLRVGHPHLRFETAVLDRLQVTEHGRVDLRCVDGGEVEPAPGEDQHARDDAPPAGDPHVWLDPAVMRVCGQRLLPALRALLPAASVDLDEAARRLDDELAALEAALHQQLDGLPRRRFYVYHPAWNHLTRRHGLIEVAIEHEGKEPDPRRLAAVIAQATEDGARALFVQPQFPRGSVQLVAESLGARVVELDPMARDWDRNLRQVAAALREELAR